MYEEYNFIKAPAQTLASLEFPECPSTLIGKTEPCRLYSIKATALTGSRREVQLDTASSSDNTNPFFVIFPDDRRGIVIDSFIQ